MMKFEDINGYHQTEIIRFFANEDENWEAFDWWKESQSRAAAEMRTWHTEYSEFKTKILRGGCIKKAFVDWCLPEFIDSKSLSAPKCNFSNILERITNDI